MNDAERFLNDYTTVVKPMNLTVEQENELMYNDDYDDVRSWIKKKQMKKSSWSDIYFGLKGNFVGLSDFIQQKREDDDWDVTPQQFQYIVWKIFKTNINTWPSNPEDVPVLPNKPESAWQSYQKLLKSKEFTVESVENISNSTQYIMNYLLNDANDDVILRSPDNPVRGMVVGNVQSGKTANMEALISLASDYRYNFFIVLTGTIDNLRRQTRDRFVKDFQTKMNNKYHCKQDFVFLDNVSASSVTGTRLADLDLSPSSNKRYVCVCLKNGKRLDDLIQWLNKNPLKKQQLNVLLIDDEADQASLNSSNISKDKITKINSDIKEIIFAKDKKDNINPYHTIAYIGYTATPYGNFLNEANEESLYPTDFICGLHVPNEYIGPQHFFGIEGENIDSLPIVNEIPEDEVNDIKEHISFTKQVLPEQLEQAILWFICTVGVFRYRNLKSPVSMLIHTSQKVDEHKFVHDAVNNYLMSLCKDINLAIGNLERVYLDQTSKESPKDFADVMPDYINVDNINDYPAFSDIESYIRDFLNAGVGYIQMSDQGECVYNNGIHLCVDNCKITDDYNQDVHIRVFYPEDDEIREKCPAFIVIGGQTLSRGLTLQGLTVSYFLRSTVLADSLMQMGRWFGYRPGYELLCRLWLSKRTVEQFKRLTRLDYDLRELIDQYRVMRWDPKQYAPAIDEFPDFKYLKITSKSHMQKAIKVDLSYANKKGQTTKFFDDNNLIKKNYDEAISFVESLGNPSETLIQDGLSLSNYSQNMNKSHYLWKNVDFNKVFDFLAKLLFPKQVASFGEIDKAKEWFEKAFNNGSLKNFSVGLPSLQKPGENNSCIHLNNVTINPITRSKEMISVEDKQNKVFRIPVLTGPADYLCDVDINTLTTDQLQIYQNPKMGPIYKRNALGLSETPLLLLYFIDKDSGKNKTYAENSKRVPLDLNNHLFGYFIYIPGGKDNKEIQTHVQVQLEFNDFVEEIEEDDEAAM